MLARLSIVVAVLAGLIPPTSSRADEPPNVVLVLADDMGLGDTSAYRDFTGNGDDVQLHTPAMERLARMGVRFTDAHTSASRCTTTRYGLLTGRYAWRSRMKFWVLFGSQGDPMIEPGRPTIASILHDRGYATAMVGKWHVGLRYRQADGRPAAGWDDADLNQPLYDSPLDHGFDVCWFTSRSHGTSGPDAGARMARRRNGPQQNIGPGHVHGRTVIAATENGKQLATDDDRAYILRELGGRHSDNALAFLSNHLVTPETRTRPFFLYYACNSNHSPYTPDSHVGDVPVRGAARTVGGQPINDRYDFIYENDVALGRLLEHLETTVDPRRPDRNLIENTIVVFTSDNGAEQDDDVATGPFRSNKGSCYEGGHRVPFLVSWPAGGVGDGDPESPGRTSDALIGLHEVFATLGEAAGVEPIDHRTGAIGGEDSTSVLAAWRGDAIPDRPLFVHDHKQGEDQAACAMRLDNPAVDGKTVPGRWKALLDASLLRRGTANIIELYDLATDPREQHDRLGEPGLAPLVEHLTSIAIAHRTAGGHRLADIAPPTRIQFDWTAPANADLGNGLQRIGLAKRFPTAAASEVTVLHRVTKDEPLTITTTAVRSGEPRADVTLAQDEVGLGVDGGESPRCDAGEAILVRFDRDVLVESATIVGGEGTCGGFVRVGDRDPLAIYCIDGDNDAKDQSGILSDLGVLRAGEVLRFDSSPQLGVETPGSWRLANLVVRPLDSQSEPAEGEPTAVTKPAADGVLRLPASRATTHGEKLRYEVEPWKNTVGFWVNADDWAEWKLDAPAGRYRVRILQGCGGGQGGSRASITVGDAAVEFEVVETGHFQNFRWRTLGEISLPGGPATLQLRCIEKAKNAVMDCRAIELVPVRDDE